MNLELDIPSHTENFCLFFHFPLAKVSGMDFGGGGYQMSKFGFFFCTMVIHLVLFEDLKFVYGGQLY